MSAEDAEVAAHNERMLGSNGTVQIIRDIPVQNLSDTDSSECEFVLERKPPHLRTPEMVSLNSESDSDVVFVNEEKGTPPKREIPPPGVFEQTKNSSDTSDSDDNKNLTVLRMKWSGAGLREVKPNTSNEPVPSTSTGGFTGSLTERQPIKLKLRKRVIKSIYESTSESESDSKDNNTPDNTLIPTVQYSTSTSEGEEPIDVVGDASTEQTPSFKRKYPIFEEESKSDTAQTQTHPKRRRLTKPRKQRASKTDLSSPKLKKVKSVIVKHYSEGNGMYVTEKKSGTESSSSSSNNGSSSSESSDDESNSNSDDENDRTGDTPGWSSTASE